MVLGGASADKLIVSARASGSRRDRSGVGLFLLDAKANGITRRDHPTQDGIRAADTGFRPCGSDRKAYWPDRKRASGAGARRR